MSLPPDPDWTDTPREAIRDNAKPKILSLTPDVCKTPIGSSTPPIPYCIVGYPDEAADNYTSSVFFTGQKAMVLRSSTTCCHGDEPGTAKGVKSGTVGDICEPLDHSATVRTEGSPVIRNLDKYYMNCSNTFGCVYWSEDTETYGDTYPDDKAAPVGQQLAFLSPVAVAAIEAAGSAGGAAAAAEGVAATGLGTVAVGALAIVTLEGILAPTKMNFSDEVPRDNYETALLKSAQDEINALLFWDSGGDIRNQTKAKLKRHREAVKSQIPSLSPRFRPIPMAGCQVKMTRTSALSGRMRKLIRPVNCVREKPITLFRIWASSRARIGGCDTGVIDQLVATLQIEDRAVLVIGCIAMPDSGRQNTGNVWPGRYSGQCWRYIRRVWQSRTAGLFRLKVEAARHHQKLCAGSRRAQHQRQ